MGVLGQCARLRRLVSARLQQLSGHWVPQHGWLLQPLVSMDGGAAHGVGAEHLGDAARRGTDRSSAGRSRAVRRGAGRSRTDGRLRATSNRSARQRSDTRLRDTPGPVPAGEEWRERSLAANVAAPRNNTVIGAGSPRDLTDRSRHAVGTNADASAQRATPSRSRLADADAAAAFNLDRCATRSTCRRLTHRAPVEARRAPSCLAAAIPLRLRMTTSEAAASSAAAPRVDPVREPGLRRLVTDGAPAASHRGFRRSSRRARQHRGNPASDRAAPRSSGRPDSPSAGARRRRRHRRRRRRRDLLASHRPARRHRGAASPPAAGARSGGSAGTAAGTAGPRSRGGGQL